VTQQSNSYADGPCVDGREHNSGRDDFVGLERGTGDELWDEYCWCGQKIRQKRWNETDGWRTA